jgi:hypothetical protein
LEHRTAPSGAVFGSRLAFSQDIPTAFSSSSTENLHVIFEHLGLYWPFSFLRGYISLLPSYRYFILLLRSFLNLFLQEMRHFESVLHKISLLESKHVHREGELRSIINRNKQLATAEMEKEMAKWKQVVEVKNREIEQFRIELDSILEVLRELRRQGVILPPFSGLART